MFCEVRADVSRGILHMHTCTHPLSPLVFTGIFVLVGLIALARVDGGGGVTKSVCGGAVSEPCEGAEGEDG